MLDFINHAQDNHTTRSCSQHTYTTNKLPDTTK